MPRETLKRIDILRHELKALRFILEHYHGGKLPAEEVPPREDFQSEQGRVIYQPVSIEPREVTPRIIREANYAEREGPRKG